MRFVDQALAAFLRLGNLAVPVAIITTWLRKGFNRTSVRTNWRTVSLWTALFLLTIADGLFWFAFFRTHAAMVLPTLRLYIRGSIAIALAGLTCALFGSGKGRWTLFATAMFTPCSWIMYFAWL